MLPRLQAAQAFDGQVLADEGGKLAGQEEAALWQVGAGVYAAAGKHAGNLGAGVGERGGEYGLHLLNQGSQHQGMAWTPC